MLLPDPNPVAMDLGGFRCFIRPGTSDAAAARESLLEQPVRRHFDLAPDQLWLDLGAYIGTFSMLVCAAGARSYAVEPLPSNAAIFRRNFQANNLEQYSELVEAAVVAFPDGDVLLNIGPTVRGRHNLWSSSTCIHWKSSRDTVRCAAVSLDELVYSAQARFGYNREMCLKLDIEGAEIEILENCDLPFEKIYFEYHFRADASVARARAIIARLAALGFDCRLSRRLPRSVNAVYWTEMTFLCWAWKK